MANVPPKLGPFEPLHRLGAGGMAETFLAVRRGPGGYEQRVCIKRILPAYESDRDFVDSFLDEARTSAALRHANIVQVVEFGLNEEDGSHYLALELVEGMDLRALMQREQHLDEELVTLIACELAAALAYAHAEDDGRPSVVHRDLSPSNVLISRSGEVKLTDFGIASVTGGIHRTASGVIKGKVPYMPPEYIDGGRFDARGDLFSLGVMLYELCHGFRPFDGDSELDTMRRIASGERRSFEAPASPTFVACIDRLLQRQPEARFVDAQALLEALPTIATFATRKRLANLVRGRPSTPAGGTTSLAEPVRTPSPSHFAPTIDAMRGPTRTQATAWSSRATRTAWLTLGGSLLLFTLVALAVLARSVGARPASGPPVLPPPPPTSPAVTERDVSDASAAPPVELDERADAGALQATSVSEVLPPVKAPRHASRQQAELRVVVYPFGDVWVDDKYAGQSPLTLHLSPGSHVIAAGEGRARERRTVRLHSGESESITFRRQPPSE